MSTEIYLTANFKCNSRKTKIWIVEVCFHKKLTKNQKWNKIKLEFSNWSRQMLMLDVLSKFFDFIWAFKYAMVQCTTFSTVTIDFENHTTGNFIHFYIVHFP